MARQGRSSVGSATTGAAVAILVAAGCGGGSSTPDWEPGVAVAVVALDDGTVVTFEGGSCERGSTSTGNDSFVLEVGEPGADGEGAIIRIGLELEGGATVAGDGSGNGVQVDHDGGRWGLAEGPEALRFDGDLRGGSVDLQAIRTLGQDADPRSGTMEFTC